MKWLKRSEPLKSGASGAPMKVLLISDYLSDKAVVFFPQSTPGEEVLFKLVGTLPIVDHAAAVTAVLEREKLGGTVVDSAISIPHARLNGLKKIELAVGICNDLAHPKDRPGLFFLFLSPKEDTKAHLLFLSSLSALFQTENFVDRLLSSKAPYEVVQKIRQIEKGV